MTRRTTAAVLSVTAALLSLALTGGVIIAQAAPLQPEDGAALTHDQMHEMMDAMHGAGFSERMHQAMPGADALIEQCVEMMTMIGQMPGMMDGMRQR